MWPALTCGIWWREYWWRQLCCLVITPWWSHKGLQGKLWRLLKQYGIFTSQMLLLTSIQQCQSEALTVHDTDQQYHVNVNDEATK